MGRSDARQAVVPPEDPGPQVLSVSELDRRLKHLVESGTGEVRVEGEVISLKEVASGHLYFVLKDEREEASIDCVMYRSAHARSRRLLEDGARVVLTGRATVYAPRGRLQFLAVEARPAGRGALLEALERLKEKLASEGLFAESRKRKLPSDPRVIGVVTSGDGAVIHDIAKVAFRRSALRIVLARATVQGANAAAEMIRALQLLSRVPEVEAIILGRGGGSADDLAAFNDEALVRAVAASPVPVVSAVGHEVNTTLTDLAADSRASTPSQAAELLVPDAVARTEAIIHLRARLRRAVAHRLRDARSTLERQTARLGTVDRLLAEPRQTIDEAQERLMLAAKQRLAARRTELVKLERRLVSRHPRAVVSAARAELRPLEVRLTAAIGVKVAACRRELATTSAGLSALSPLSVLARGYAIATDPSGRAILDPASVRPGDTITIRVHHGSFVAVVPAPSAPDPSDSPGDRSGRHRDA